MKEKNSTKRVFKALGCLLVCALVLVTCTSEYQGKWELRSNAKAGTPLGDFHSIYGEPRYTYHGWDALPQPYQELFTAPVDSEDTYYSYQMEGLPSYWSFVVSTDSSTHTVLRYIYWKAIALKPKENI